MINTVNMALQIEPIVRRKSSASTAHTSIQEDQELDELIATFPEQTASFLTQLRAEYSNPVEKSVAPDVNEHTPDKTLLRTSRVIVPQIDNGDAPFYGQTTYRNFFGQASNRCIEPSLRFGEMPVFTDSILYPGQQRRMQSTTHETFVSKPLKMVEPAKPIPPTLCVEGERYFETTNRSAFTNKTGDRQAQVCQNRSDNDKIKQDAQSHYRKPFVADTQFRADFPPERAWNSVQPECSCAPEMVIPPESEIWLRDNDQYEFRTEQRDQFPGRDPRTNPVPKSYKKEVPPYTRPAVKFADTTVTKSDYPAYTLTQLQSAKHNKAILNLKPMNSTSCMKPDQLTEEEAKLLKTHLKTLNLAKQSKLPRT